MKIAIISDIHDAKSNLIRGLEQAQNTDRLLVLGDLCSPFIVHELGKRYANAIDVVFGNNDGDLYRITANAAQYPQITLHGEFATFDLGGLKIAINHFDTIGRALAKGAHFDVVAFGHNHQFEITYDENGGITINPGEIYGGVTGTAGFVVLDTESRSAHRITL